MFHCRRWYRAIAVMFVALMAGCSGSGGGLSTAASDLPVPAKPQNAKAPRDYTFASTVSPDLFICIPSVTTRLSCSSPISNPTEWIEVSALSFGNSRSYAISNGVVTTPGNAQFSSMNLIKFADSTSPVVQLALYSHRVISDYVRLIETKPSPTGALPFVEIDLQNATIATDSLSGSSASSVSESLSLNFSAMQYAIQSTTGGGLTGTIYAYNWDISRHSPDFRPQTILPAPGVPAAVARSTRIPANNHRVLIPDALARAVAADAKTTPTDVQTILNGSLTELLSIPGVPGTSTVPGYASATEINSFSVGAQALAGTGPPGASLLSYSKPIDLNSTALWALIARGLAYSGTPVELDLVDATMSPARKMAYFLLGSPPYPASYDLGGSVGSQSQEAVSIFYTLLDFCVIPYTNGTAGIPVCHGYDYRKNVTI